MLRASVKLELVRALTLLHIFRLNTDGEYFERVSMEAFWSECFASCHRSGTRGEPQNPCSRLCLLTISICTRNENSEHGSVTEEGQIPFSNTRWCTSRKNSEVGLAGKLGWWTPSNKPSTSPDFCQTPHWKNLPN